MTFADAKGKYHLLVIPRGQLIRGLSQLNETHLPLLERMRMTGCLIASWLRLNRGVPAVQCGFHAIPSMTQLHMHVVSRDLAGDGMRTAKHWRSFQRPFFVPVSEVISMLSKDGHVKVR